MKRFGRLASAWIVWAAAACGGEPEPPERLDPAQLRAGVVTDDGGVEHRTRGARGWDRVISLVPSATDFILEFGQSERLIARTRFDEDPRLANLPDVGGGLDPSVERIVFLKPDLVIAWPDAGDRSVVERLKTLGIAVYQARIETLEDTVRHARQIGALVGARPRANSWIEELEATRERLETQVGARERPGVLFVASASPPIVAGSNTFVDALISMAGGRNLFSDAEQPWPQVSLEAAARRGPDVVLVSGPVAPLGRGGWRAVSGRREALDPALFARPGPRVGEAADALHGILHPEPSP